MATGRLPVERLRDYLRQLPSGARALLVAELERSLLRGDEIPGGDLLLQEVRSAVRASAAPTPRINEPARAFFQAVEPYLVDDDDRQHKHCGRIARMALAPLWLWICRDLAPSEAEIYGDDVRRALAVGDWATCEERTHAFQDRIIEAIQA